MTMHADMETLTDMFGGNDSSPFGEIIKKGKDNSYYHSFGLNLLKQFDSTENYYHFLTAAVGDFQKLSDQEKEMIQNKMGIFPKTIIQEKIVYKEKKANSKHKPKLNTFDDY
jgi:hypothetical protein